MAPDQSMVEADPYREDATGIARPAFQIEHRSDEYPDDGFASLLAMQERHFWFRGRHRFILHFARRAASALPDLSHRAAIDLGGGCGGWIRYLDAHAPGLFLERAIGDSSADALRLAGAVLPADVRRYQIDLLRLEWQQRWDVAFLLDVLEHIDDDEGALRQIRQALRPGGLLIVTTPALERFRSHWDTMCSHVRRYSRRDFARLASRTGFELVSARYFMFVLSPAMLAARLITPDPARMTAEQIRDHLVRTDRVPREPVNTLLAGIFAAETPLGAYCPFPWGTSVLGLLRRPD